MFTREVSTVVKIAIMAALDIDGKINNDKKPRKTDSKTRVSYWPAKREVNRPRVDNYQRLLWAYPKYYS